MKSIMYTFMVFSALIFLTTSHAKSQIELVNLDVPAHNVELKPVHFSQAITSDKLLMSTKQGYESNSDEYWFEVSGAELNNGVNLAISQPGALIRVSGLNTSKYISQNVAIIDPQNIELYKSNNKLTAPFKETISKQQLATANIFPNSSAVKLDKLIGNGQFKLLVNQRLTSTQRFIINVKEKNSPHTLHLATPSMNYNVGQKVDIQIDFKNNEHSLTTVNHKGFIKSPSGIKYPVELMSSTKGFQVNIPDDAISDKIGQLYELHLESQAIDKSLKIKRNGKVAFNIVQPTAKLQDEIIVNTNEAQVSLTVASEGRYEISGLVYGINKQGQAEAFMLSRSAYYLQPGEYQLPLRFDNNIIKASGLAAPFDVKHLRLMDQSRMALLQQNLTPECSPKYCKERL